MKELQGIVEIFLSWIRKRIATVLLDIFLLVKHIVNIYKIKILLNFFKCLSLILFISYLNFVLSFFSNYYLFFLSLFLYPLSSSVFNLFMTVIFSYKFPNFIHIYKKTDYLQINIVICISISLVKFFVYFY